MPSAALAAPSEPVSQTLSWEPRLRRMGRVPDFEYPVIHPFDVGEGPSAKTATGLFGSVTGMHRGYWELGETYRSPKPCAVCENYDSPV
jgi:hypothetical protein